MTRVEALTEAIEPWAQHWSNDPQPFIWQKTANEIITKVKRGRATLTAVTESATHH